MSRRRAGAAALVVALLVVLVAVSAAAAAPGGLALVGVAKVDNPVGVVSAPGDRTRLFVVEQAGRIVEVRGRATSVYADLTDRVEASGGEQGLLGLAFAPDYQASGKLYVYYTAKGTGDLVVSELRRSDADHADPGSERVILRIPHRADPYENGGQLAFGPDGKLWIGTGDGGDPVKLARNSQLLDPAGDDAGAGYDALLGKLLRIDPTPGDGCGGGCTIPADNPGFAQREVWAYGLRNPWRFSFDSATGDLYLGDVGDAAWEEVDVATAASGTAKGTNFGWPFFEGRDPGPSAAAGVGATPPPGCCTGPAIVRAHGDPDGWNALIGGLVSHDPGTPALSGKYLYGSLNTGTIRAATVQGGQVVADVDTGLKEPGLTSFGADGCGRVYLTALNGWLYRISQGEGACDAVGVTLDAKAGQRVGRTGTLRASLACAVACRAQVRVSVVRGTAILGRTATTTVSLTANRSRSLTIRVNRALRTAISRQQRAGRTVSARVTVTAAGTAGGTRRTTQTTRLAS